MISSKRILCLIVTAFFTFNFFFTSATAASVSMPNDSLQYFGADETEINLKLQSNIADFSSPSENTSLSTATYYNFSESDVINLPKINIKRGPELFNVSVELSFDPFPGTNNYKVFFSKDGNFENPDFIETSDYTFSKYPLKNFVSSNEWYVCVLAYNDNEEIIAHSDVKKLEMPEDYPLVLDSSIAKIIRKAINKPTGEIYKSDVEKITVLDASNQGLYALNGISLLPNLKVLYAQDNLIRNFPFNELAKLEKLSKVDLSNNLLGVYSASSLDLTNVNIESLNLSNNCLERIRFSEENSSIKELDLSSNKIKDISEFEKLTSLESLYLKDNPIEDFSSISEYNDKLKDMDFILPSPTPSQTPITFPDENLEKAIRSSIGRSNGSIYESHLSNIKHLTIPDNNIENLEGIQYLSELRVLSISNNLVTNIEPLRSLKNLKDLYLEGNKIEDIEPLGELKNLNSLFMSDCGVSDVSPLENLTKLNYLYIENNNIADISALGELKNLCVLWLNNNKVTDISALSDHTNLVMLVLDNNKISDISALEKSVYLQDLYLSNNPLDSIDVLGNLVNLQSLALNSTGISNCNSLKELKKLSSLGLINNNISDISFLSSLKRLSSLNIGKNKNIKDYSAIKELVDLSLLGIENNSLENIDFVSSLTGLTHLSAGGNSIKDLTPLKKLYNLKILDLANNEISDINSLSKLNRLSILYLALNNIFDFSPVSTFYDKLQKKDFKLDASEIASIIINTDSITITKGNTPKKLTYAEFARFLVKTFDLKGTLESDLTFPFVSTDDEYYEDIVIAYENNIFYPIESTDFKPNDYVTRREYAYRILETLKYQSLYTLNSHIKDIDITSDLYFKENLAAITAIDAGLMTLNEDYLFCPEEIMLLDIDAQLVPIVSPQDAVNKRVKWSSSNEKVAIVNSTGFVKGISPGTAEITAETLDGKYSAKCVVTVLPSDDEDEEPEPTSDPQPTPRPTKKPGGNSGGSSGGNSGGGGSGGGGSKGGSSGAGSDSPTPTPTSTSTPTSTNTPSPTPTSTTTPTSAPIATPVPTPTSINFSDLDKHWAKETIETLSRKGIINGYPDGTFRPDANMTRAEVAVVLAKAIGLNSTKSNLAFKDAENIPQWAEGFIQAIVDKGIIKGYEDGEFKPNRVLTRKEMVVMAVNAFNIEGSEIQLPFTDSNTIPEWAKSSVIKAFSSDIVKGYADNTFKPDKEVTRAEVCTIIAKCLELVQ